MVSGVFAQPLRRLITPIGFGDKFFKSKHCLGFSLKPFLKRLVIMLSCCFRFRSVFAQAFFEKACGQAVFLKRLAGKQFSKADGTKTD